MSKAKDQAVSVVKKAKELGFKLEVLPNVVRVHRDFKPGDVDAFNYCDSAAYDVLSLCPLRGGSIWGTDGGSIGGAVALRSGSYTLNKSGDGSNFLKALKKELGGTA